jgi:beta-glucosidase
MAQTTASVAHPQSTPPSTAPYLNARLSIEARVADLLARMTLEEKVGQLEAPLGWEMYRKSGDRIEVTEKFQKMMQGPDPGTLYGVERADPWTKVTLQTGLSPRDAAEASNALQSYAVAHSRLHIPMLLAEECPHGHMAIGATTFPTSIGQASTWDPNLIHQLAQAVAQETRAAGANVCYGPILDIAREPRWSRVEETYGEDPFLTAQLGVAFVRGLQGVHLSDEDSVAATLKHFAGYGQPQGGHNAGPTDAGPREIATVFLPAFKAGVKAGAASVMASYNSIDGVPSSANGWLLTDVLRKQWGFEGFVVSDLTAIDALASTQGVAANNEDAAILALNAGMDSDLGANTFPELVRAVRDGRVSPAALDNAVRRVLRVKFQLGLFDSIHADPVRASKLVRSEEHKSLARKVADESIVLLKNKGGLLPLNRNIDSIAVIGPNADSVYNQLGDYTAPQEDGRVTTVLEGIYHAVGAKTTICYAQGAGIRGMSEDGFANALKCANQSSVVVVVLGGSSARNFNTLFANTGAARPEMDANGSDMEAGEGFDRSSLEFAGVQQKLLENIVATGKPVVLVVIAGRPLELNWAAENVPSILQAWYPGEAGGLAIADVLFGAMNPAGRLPISIPRSVGQLPDYYGQTRADYVDSPGSPLFAFGFGLSYSSFAYSNLHADVHPDANGIGVEVSVDISNTSKLAGDEVAQLYLHPLVSSVVVPAKSLRGFERIHLEAGEKRTVHFALGPQDLAVFNQKEKWAVEPGVFEVMVGGSSDGIRCTTQFRIDKTVALK